MTKSYYNRVKVNAYCIGFLVLICYSSTTEIQYEGDYDDVDVTQFTDNEILSILQSDDRRDCNTKPCLDLMRVLKRNLDTSTKPCDDMYQYACGGMLKRPSSTKKNSESTFGNMHKQEIIKLKNVLDGLKDRKENDVFSKVHNWYSACMNIKQINKLGTRPMLEVLDSLGTWPILNPSWSEEDWDLEKTLAMIHQNIGVFPLFMISVDNDARNVSSLYRLSISKTKLSLESPQFYLTKSKFSDRILFAYFRLLKNLAEVLGAKQLQLKDDILDVIKFEIDLAAAIRLDKKEYLVSPVTTLGALRRARYEGKVFDWKRYISFLYQDLPEQAAFQDDEIINVQEPEYFKDVMLLVGNVKSRVLANYMLAQVVFQYSGMLSEEVRQPYLEFYKAVYGSKAFNPLWERCVGSTTFHLNAAVTALYVKKYLPDKDLDKAKDLVHRLVRAYRLHLDKIKWMDKKTKEAAEEKVQNILEHVGYPKEIMNTTVLEKGYSQVEVNPLTYFENVQKDYQLFRKMVLNLRGTKPNRQSWNMRYTVQNAQYNPSGNKIGVAAGLLQPPLFHSDFPNAINFGSIGMATGHEITHGFDAAGSMYDKDGNVKLWWTSSTLEKFKEKTKCMAKQYSKFLVYGHHLNGNQTLNENIADNGGLRIAYEAYSKWVQTQGPDLTLPSITLTSKQLFFLSFSQTWCYKNTKNSAIYSLFTDEHSPAKARVNYVLSNMKEFSDAFKCAKGSPMNPKKKCIVW